MPRCLSCLTALTRRAPGQKMLLLVSAVPVTAAARPACSAKVPDVPRLASAGPGGDRVDLGAAGLFAERVDLYKYLRRRRLQSLRITSISIKIMPSV
jgi:hypothetical protein